MKNINRIYFLLIASVLFLFLSSCKNDDIILTPNTPVDPVVGDYYEGGYVFYFDKIQKVGMVCAPYDQSTSCTWSNATNYILTGANGTAIGTGQANTTAIVVAQGPGTYAAKLCDDLVLNGYSDWFLPSIGELYLMYDTLCQKGIADLSYGVYWSSSEYNSAQAWNMLYMNGAKLFPPKNGAYDVRAVRSFKIVSTPPTLTTAAVSAITSNTAVSGGTISSAGSASVTAKGVCWSITSNPTILLATKTIDGSGIGSFTSSIIGLTPLTKYYVRAYATSSAGTAYGNEVSFTTLAGGTSPTLTTVAVTSITSSSSVSGGAITSTGTAAITARGVCWSTTTNPTITLTTKTSDGTGIGSFTSNLTGLLPNTTYYVKAYATSSVGTSYGNEVSFKTLGTPPTLTTAAITSITSTSSISGGNITSAGSDPVTARGVCWSTTTGPTISLTTKTSNGTGTGAFTSNLSGLVTKTKYYVRAYATSNAGTSYGNEIIFTTL